MWYLHEIKHPNDSIRSATHLGSDEYEWDYGRIGGEFK